MFLWHQSESAVFREGALAGASQVPFTYLWAGVNPGPADLIRGLELSPVEGAWRASARTAFGRRGASLDDLSMLKGIHVPGL